MLNFRRYFFSNFDFLCSFSPENPCLPTWVFFQKVPNRPVETVDLQDTQPVAAHAPPLVKQVPLRERQEPSNTTVVQPKSRNLFSKKM